LPTVPSLGPVEIASTPPGTVPDPAGGAATFGEVLSSVQNSAPLAPTPVPLTQPSAPPLPQVEAEPIPGPVPASPAPSVQRTNAPPNQKNGEHRAKSASNPDGENGSGLPASVPVAATPLPEPAPPPTIVAASVLPSTATARTPAPAMVSGHTSQVTAGTSNEPNAAVPTPPTGDSVGLDPPKDQAGVTPETPASPTKDASNAAVPATSNPPASPRGLGMPADPAPHSGPPHVVLRESAATATMSADRREAPHSDTAAPVAARAASVSVTPEQPAQATSPLVAATPAGSTAIVSAPVHPTHPAMPAAQIAPTLLTLAKTADGNQQVTVRLNPIELGMVQIRLDRAPSGTTHVQIVADRPETLQALQRDQPALHRTLDEAGIPGAGRTIAFHNAHSEPSASGSNGSPQGSSPPHSSAGRSASSGPGGSSGGASSRGGYPGRGANPSSSKPATGAAAVTMAADTTLYRIGLNITA
jgi:flagellar hook-length control protein FliK